MTKYVAQVKKVLKDIKVAESIFKGMYCKKYYLKIGFWLWLGEPEFSLSVNHVEAFSDNHKHLQSSQK